MYREHLGFTDLLHAGASDVSSFLKFLYTRKLKPRSATRAFAAVRGLHRFLILEKATLENPTSNVEQPRWWKPLPNVLVLEVVVKLITSSKIVSPKVLLGRAILEVL